MDGKRQTCQSCRSMDVRNVIVRNGKEQVIFVRCSRCRELVARYQLKDYSHHGKGIESYLRAHGVAGGDNARAWLDAFKESREQAVVDFEESLRLLKVGDKEI